MSDPIKWQTYRELSHTLGALKIPVEDYDFVVTHVMITDPRPTGKNQDFKVYFYSGVRQVTSVVYQSPWFHDCLCWARDWVLDKYDSLELLGAYRE